MLLSKRFADFNVINHSSFRMTGRQTNDFKASGLLRLRLAMTDFYAGLRQWLGSRSIGVVLIGCVIVLNGCAFRNNLVTGIESFKAQDFREAFVRLMPSAQAGNPDAQYAIGYMYYYGKGVVEDKKAAWYWINCAAKAGQPDAIQAVIILAPEADATNSLLTSNQDGNQITNINQNQ